MEEESELRDEFKTNRKRLSFYSYADEWKRTCNGFRRSIDKVCSVRIRLLRTYRS